MWRPLLRYPREAHTFWLFQAVHHHPCAKVQFEDENAFFFIDCFVSTGPASQLQGRKHTLNSGITWGCWASFGSLMDFTSSFLPDALASLALSLHPNSQQHWQSLAFNHFWISHYMTFPENILKYASNNAHSTRIWGFALGLHDSCRLRWQGPDIFLNICVSYFFHGYGKIPANINLKWEGFVWVCSLRMQSIMADTS